MVTSKKIDGKRYKVRIGWLDDEVPFRPQIGHPDDILTPRPGENELWGYGSLVDACRKAKLESSVHYNLVLVIDTELYCDMWMSSLVHAYQRGACRW